MQTKITTINAPQARPSSRRGSTLMMTLVFVLMFAALASSMVAFSQGNVMVQAADTDTKQALMAAESGMSFLVLEMQTVSLPIIKEGNVSSMGANATQLWSGSNVESIAGNNGVAVSLAKALNTSGVWGAGVTGAVTPSGTLPLSTSPVNVDSGNTPASFTLSASWDGVYTPATSASYALIHLASTGKCNTVSRTVKMDIYLQKKLNYAVYSNVAIQLGKNVHVVGDIASTYAGTGKGPPVQSFSDMHFFTNTGNLDSTLATFRGLLGTYDPNHINRIDVANLAAANAAKNAGLKDVNGDGYIDEWDIGLQKFGTKTNNTTGVFDPYGITKVNFTDPSTGKLYDPDYFTLNDANADNVIYQDNNGQIPAKITGNVKMAITMSAWNNAASGWSQWGDITGGTTGKAFTDQFEGTVLSNNPQPVEFGVDFSSQQALTPQDFDTSPYDNKIPTTAIQKNVNITYHNQLNAYDFANGTLSASQANGGTITEHSPASVSSGWQATYTRPVFQNMHFYNVRIPQGLNAKFINCTFDGYTSVKMTTTITKAGTNTTTSDPTEGNKWAQQMTNGTTFSPDTALTGSNSIAFQKGNNLHFSGCTFTGPVTADVPTAYTHFADSWEFDTSSAGKDTNFANIHDQTVTILAPNTNIEMGGFNNPGANPTTLVGVVVAGNLDVRGTANFDGSIVVTGNGATNTTLGYFGSTDQGQGVPIPGQLPGTAKGAYGHLNFKINPDRGMPDGIIIPVVAIPQYSTYQIQ